MKAIGFDMSKSKVFTEWFKSKDDDEDEEDDD